MSTTPLSSDADDSDITRRGFLKTSASAALGSTLGASVAVAAEKRGLIGEENAKPGSNDWQLTRVRLDKNGGFRAPTIEGYCSKQSVLADETLDIMVSTSAAVQFTIEIFRTGY